MALDDSELLAILATERRNSVGFDEDPELTKDREVGLRYYKGDMFDMPTEENRSGATSSDVSDAVETALPDLIEIFVGGDDVLAFSPNRQDDEKAAEQETDYVKHVFFNENPGFLIMLSMLKDALQSKLGVVKWWWDASYGQGEETFESQTQAEVEAASLSAEIRDLVQRKPEPGEQEPLYDFTAYKTGGRLCVEEVPPEDFTAARDSKLNLGATTYCAIRARPRAQDLIAQGLDRGAVEKLPPYGSREDETVAWARDTVDEQSLSGRDGTGDLRQVEVVEHYIRLADDDGKLALHRVLTGGNESILLHQEPVNRIQYAVITPYPVPHRLYGQSVADKLIEVQRIKTALLRMLLDSGYFAINQRHQVVESKTSENTLSDLMRNEPMVPVRVKQEGAVTPLGSSGLDFDVTGALEYMSTVGEQRTGIVRNAQGLNPDTLHSTATGAVALMGAAQKRLRLMARTFAETGLKDLFLGIHATLRENATQGATVRLRGQWVPIDPTQWGERNDMTVQVGLGSAGREHDIAALREAIPVLQSIVQEQGGLNGPLITAQNVYAILIRMMEKLGFKDAERYVSDPTQAPPQQPGAQPDPDATDKAKLALQAQVEQASHDRANAQMQIDAQTAAAQIQAKAQGDAAKLQFEAEQAVRDHDYRTAQLAQQRDIEFAKIESAERIAAGQASTAIATTALKDQTTRDVASMKDQTQRLDIAGDLAIQSSEQRDSTILADKDE